MRASTPLHRPLRKSHCAANRTWPGPYLARKIFPLCTLSSQVTYLGVGYLVGTYLRRIGHGVRRRVGGFDSLGVRGGIDGQECRVERDKVWRQSSWSNSFTGNRRHHVHVLIYPRRASRGSLQALTAPAVMSIHCVKVFTVPAGLTIGERKKVGGYRRD